MVNVLILERNFKMDSKNSFLLKKNENFDVNDF